MQFFMVIFTLALLATASEAQAQQKALREAFDKVGKTIESGSCAKDVVVDVSDSVTTLCNQSKEKQDEDSDDIKYLKNADKTLSCNYENGLFEVTISEGIENSEEGDVQISIDESGKIIQISKDQLKVDGQTCQKLAQKFDKGGRVPASADSELCFDYYPSNKLNVARVSSCSEAKKLSQKN